MENLAAELLDEIFTLACTDGGYTGCSLSLVSKHLRAASRSARFYSVILVSGSAQQLSQFSSCFFSERTVTSGTTPRVRHLCIASAKRKARVAFRPKDEDDHEQQAFVADVAALLVAVAPDLYTLSLIYGHRPIPDELRFPDVLALHFPLLEELTIVGAGYRDLPVCSLLDPCGGCPIPSTSLPRLSRLHLTYTFSGMRTGMDLDGWAGRAPHITHFRVSNVSYYSSGILGQLKAFIDSEDHRDAETCIFPMLEQLLFQPSAPPTPGGQCGNPYISYARYTESLRKMRHNARRPFEVLRPGERMGAFGESALCFEQGAAHGFLDRLDGRLACWDISPGVLFLD